MIDLFDKAYAAGRARISTQTLDRHIANGIGPRVTRVGKRVLFAGPDIEAWLAHCRR